MKRALYAIALLSCMVVVLALSLGKDPEVTPYVDQIDKLYHLGAYAVVGFLWAVNLMGGRHGNRGAGRVVALAFAVTFAYGVALELFQYLTPDRNAELLDALANGVGGLIGAYAGARLSRGKDMGVKEAGR